MPDEASTIRERVERAVAFLHRQDAVVLTTFNLSAAFLEDQVLPIVLGVDAKTTAARHGTTHQRLGAVPCTVFYDPNVPPKVSGRFRYVARPVPIRGRFFHPKLIILSGQCEDGIDWVYLAVSSANLSLSGWGRNVEAFGETWIHTQSQQSWAALDQLLAWLQTHAPLGDTTTNADAVSRVRATLARMPGHKRFRDDEDQPWSGTLYARLYSSVVHPDGLAAFMRAGRTHRPSELWACSPYWSDVSAGVDAFDAHETILLPALRADRSALSLTEDQRDELPESVELRRNKDDNTERYWHMKAYCLKFQTRWFTAVGSCNFTQAGLSGASGNVEAALVFEDEPDWFPDGPLTDEGFATEHEAEEGAPDPAPIQIVVAYDWRPGRWRWWLEAGTNERDFRLQLPGHDAIQTTPGTHALEATPPPRGSTFTIHYQTPSGPASWQGQVVELNLDHSERVYGRPLSATEILDSWRGRPPAWDLGGGGGTGDGDEEADDAEPEVAAAFDAVNLYDLYRAMRSVRAKLESLASHPEDQRALLVGRPDSVMALALLADRDDTAAVVRYLVLQELLSVLRDWKAQLDPVLLKRARTMLKRARQAARARLGDELGPRAAQADEMLAWFERRLSRLDRRAP